MKIVQIGKRQIGKNNPCFIIAEAGVNHNGDRDVAFQLIVEAAHCGADAVKFQTFKTEQLVTETAPKAQYQLHRTEPAESQYQMLKRLEFSAGVHRELFEFCQQQNILFMSSAFDEQSADLLENMGVAVFKVPSGEITNIPLLVHIALKKRPIILSTGMSTLGEVEAAVNTIENTGNTDLILLHCVSNYPAEVSDVNLRAIKTMKNAFGVPVGYSDHTLGMEIALAAVVTGACVIEKHFTLDRNMPGSDHQASLEPKEFIKMVAAIRKVESAMGSGRKEPTSSESDTAAVARKSLVAACDIPANTVITDKMISVKRPGTGIVPGNLKFILGHRVSKSIQAGTVIKMEMLK